MKTILITGGAGFIGSNFIPYFLKVHPEYRVVNLDILSYASDWNNLKEVLEHPRHYFVEGDICKETLVRDIFKNHDIRGVIHFAAESHVDNSIATPEAFVQSNVVGTFRLLHVAKEHWMSSPHHYKESYENCRFHHISTDEVYGSLGSKGLFTEESPYAPNSPYSATKASSDMLVRSYFHTYGLQTVITNCSNNYGPKQHDEKLIPTIIRKALSNQRIPIYGDGKNIRDWLYVEDHCRGINLVYCNATAGQTYNIGCNHEKDNLSISKYICLLLDELIPKASGESYISQIELVADRPGHDRRYAVNATKIKKDLDWKSMESFESGIRKTVLWYIEKYNKKT